MIDVSTYLKLHLDMLHFASQRTVGSELVLCGKKDLRIVKAENIYFYFFFYFTIGRRSSAEN